MQTFLAEHPPILQSLMSHHAWPTLAFGLRVIFFVLFGLLLIRMHFRLSKEGGRGVQRLPFAVWVAVPLILFLLAGRQAVWQLLGSRNEKFVGFMQRYDRREFNPAHLVRSGKILDRNGAVLAESRVTPRGIQRLYRHGPLFSHAIGYNNPVYGLSGVESAARADLVGGPLRTKEDLARFGTSLLDRKAHAEGPSLKTTLDLRLQRKARDLMEGRTGAVVLMDVETGDLLVLLSSPDFDPNRLYPRVFNAGNAPLVNRALAGQYPPGSVFKVLIAAAALQTGATGTLNTPVEGWTAGKGNPPIRDHEYYSAQKEGRRWKGHGPLSLGQALAKSSNTYFAQLGPKIGSASLGKIMDTSGLTQSIPLWNKTEGTLTLRPARLPSLQDSQAYGLGQFCIGQGDVLVSPLHMAMISAAVANGGRVVFPRLDPTMTQREGGSLCPPPQAESLRRMMVRVVEEGTGRGMRMPEISSGGKTGTAQTGTGRESHSWYVGFAPATRPKWAFCVMIEHGGYGSVSALPVARELLRFGVKEGILRP
jgi:peptidoglycan glycosyltransferase